jgi:hypothetical protein
MVNIVPRARSFVTARRRWFLAAGIALVAYSAFGFLILPWVLHRQLEKRLTATLHREVSIQRVRANPFALSVTIDGLLIKDRDGSVFVSWERLYVNARVLPIVKRELALDALRLVRLRTNVVMARDGTLNFSDILASLPADEPTPATQPKKSTFVLGVDHLAIEEAQLDFSDLSRARPFRTTVGPFTIRLEEFRTQADAKNPYAFTGTTESGETFSWSGSVNTEPIRSRGTFTLEGIRLSKYSPYYEQSVGFELVDGTARVQASYLLGWAPEKRVLQMSDGTLAVRKLVLRLRGASEPKVELPELDITTAQADFLAQTAEVGAVTLKGGTVRVRRGADGLFDVTRLASPATAPATGQPAVPGPITTPPPSTPPASRKPSKPFRWTVRRVEVTDQKITFDDDLPPRPVKLVLAPIAVSLGNLSSDKAALSTLAMSVGWNGKGEIKVDGGFSLWKPSADLTLHAKGLDLPSIDPYLPVYGNLDARLGDGRFGIDGRARVDLAPSPMTSGFEGDVNVDALVLLDAVRGQELIRWKALQILGIQVASQPQSVAIRSIRWIEPRVKVQIAEDGSSNAKRMLRSAAAPQATAGKPPAEAKPAPAPAAAPVSIGTFQIVRGNGGLVDRSVQPPALFGVSDLDVRVRGLSNIDDPDFRLSKLIWHAVGNVFTKIVTAPFALLGKLFGGGAERLDIVEFAAGSAEVDARAEKALQGLNKALAARPALKLDLEGTADPVADGKVLRKQALRQQAREAKWKTGKHGSAASPDTVELLEDEYVKFIEAEYKRTVTDAPGAKPDPKAPAPGVGEKEEVLLGKVVVGPEAVRVLAQQRAEVARERILKGASQVDPGRLFLVQGGERAKKDGGAHVYFTLK